MRFPTGDASELSMEDLIEAYNKAQGIIEEQTAAKDILREYIIEQLEALKVQGMKTKNGYLVSKTTFPSFSGVLLSTARELGATKMEESIDTGKLKKLQEKGVSIKGSKNIMRLTIKEAK